MGKDHYPFTAFLRSYTWPQWIMMICIAPYAMWVAMQHIYKKGKDVNCIRQHDIYMKGQLEAIFSKRMSMKKSKEKAK